MADTLPSYRKKAQTAVQQGRNIQKEIDSQGTMQQDEAEPSAFQGGQREYPSKFPPQHIVKPGKESELEPSPMFEAPAYKGSEKLLDKVAIITGGDSGIGRAVAVLYAREGADVALVYLNEHTDAEETKKAVEAEGRRCLELAGDVSDPAFCNAVVEKTLATFGKIDILVNNAAFQQHADKIENLSEKHFDRTLKTNLYGYFYMAKAAVPQMEKGGAILMTGSVTGIEGSKRLLDYSMTKGGIHAFTRSLAAQLVEHEIRVNCVAPGPVWTPLNPADKPAKDVSSFGSSTTMKRAAQPEEIAPAFVFLAAPSCSSYITGEILPIVGGYGSN